MDEVSAYIGYQLIQVLKAHRHLAEAGFSAFGIYVGQEFILFRLAEQDGIAQSELAEHLCVEAPTVTKMVRRMEAAGLVERRQDPEDGRLSRVFLTAKGRAAEQSARRVWHELEATTVKGLSDAEQMLLHRLLVQIGDNLTSSSP